jgi:predicted aspartyl protease
MKYTIIIFFIHLFSFNSIAQNLSLNQGETTQKDYFSSIKFENISGFIIVKATIQGKIYRFILDTGAPNTITKALCDKLNPTFLFEEKMVDANGTSNQGKFVNIKEWTFGNVVFNNIPTYVVDSFILFECMQIDGFIGSNMLRNSIIQISYTDETLILTDNATRLNLSEKFASNMELLGEQSNPYIEINLRGEVEGSDWAQFDTGFTGFYNLSLQKYDSVFSKYPIFKLDKTGFGGNSMGLWGFTEAKCHQLTAPEITINGVAFRNVSTETSLDDNSRIGHELFKYGKVTVDYLHKKFYFEPYKTSIDLTEKAFPISLKFEGNKLLIGTIWGEKYAQLIQIGDQILSIDGVNCETINPCYWLIKGSLLDEKDKAQLVVKTKTGKFVDILMERE